MEKLSILIQRMNTLEPKYVLSKIKQDVCTLSLEESRHSRPKNEEQHKYLTKVHDLVDAIRDLPEIYELIKTKLCI